MPCAPKKGLSNTNRTVCILVAEDDFAMRSFLSNALLRIGYDVQEIATEEELQTFLADTASTVSDKKDPGVDVIVSAINLPGKTAFDVLSDFKCVKGTVPIILITAFSDPETAEEAIRLGATAVFDKPFDMGDFKRFITNLVPPTAAQKATDQ